MHSLDSPTGWVGLDNILGYFTDGCPGCSPLLAGLTGSVCELVAWVR